MVFAKLLVHTKKQQFEQIKVSIKKTTTSDLNPCYICKLLLEFQALGNFGLFLGA
jgi:hypothetical protein